MRIFVFLVCVLALPRRGRSRISSIRSYNEDFSDVEFPDDREDCIDGTCSLQYAAEKRMIVPEKVVGRRQFMPRSFNMGDSFTPWEPTCGCVTQYELMNLGEGHYPRYITIAKCKSKTCSNKFYQCKYYDYRVHVLVKRGLSSILKNSDDMDVRDVQELKLPESIHANWQLFAMSVSVACVVSERS